MYVAFVLHLHNKTTVKFATDIFQNDTEWIAIELQLRLTTLIQLITIIIKYNYPYMLMLITVNFIWIKNTKLGLCTRVLCTFQIILY